MTCCGLLCLLIDNYNRLFSIMLFNQSIIPIYPETINLGLINAFNNISNKNGDNPYL